MSEEQLQKFLQAIKASPELQAMLASGKADAAVAIAKEAGFSITAEEFESAPGLSGVTAVTEEEIEGIYGGDPGQKQCTPQNNSGIPDSNCGWMEGDCTAIV
jgi:predicted ribosomally synthesized peptide with nif11-like leader